MKRIVLEDMLEGAGGNIGVSVGDDGIVYNAIAGGTANPP